jgi:hypothetical protein
MQLHEQLPVFWKKLLAPPSDLTTSLDLALTYCQNLTYCQILNKSQTNVSANKVNYVAAMKEIHHVQLKTYCDILVTTMSLQKMTVSKVHVISTNKTIQYGKSEISMLLFLCILIMYAPN